MPLVKRFEDLVAWQEARILNQRIYKLCQCREIAGDFELKNQLRGVALSVMTNIAEGFDCDSNTEFARFLGIARRSAVEVQSLLYSAIDAGHIDQATLDAHYAQAAKAKALIGGLKQSLIQRKKT
jgi:four helix bundle protein